MWASSFADLAKKASELQEQASAAAASSLPASASQGFGPPNLFNLDGLQHEVLRVASDQQVDCLSKNESDTCAVQGNASVIPQDISVDPRTSEPSKLVIPTANSSSFPSIPIGLKEKSFEAIPSITTRTTVESNNTNTPPTTTTIPSDTSILPPAAAPQTVTLLIPQQGGTATLLSQHDHDSCGDDKPAPPPVIIESSPPHATKTDGSTTAPPVDFPPGADVEKHIPVPTQKREDAYHSPYPQQTHPSNNSVDGQGEDDKDDQGKIKPVWERQLESKHQVLPLSDSILQVVDKANDGIGEDSLGFGVEHAPPPSDPETSEEASSTTLRGSIFKQQSHARFIDERDVIVNKATTVVPDHVLQSFSLQLKRLEENHRTEFSKMEKDHEGVLYQLKEELEWYRSEQARHARQIEMMKENYSVEMDRLQTDLDGASQMLQDRDKEKKRMQAQQLRELRSMEKKLNLLEEEGRSSRLTVEELQKSLMDSNSQVSSSNDSYEALKARVKVVAGELKERRVECRELQSRVEELTEAKTQLEEKVSELEAQGTDLDRARSAILLEFDTLKKRLEMTEKALEQSRSAVRQERLNGEEMLAAYKKKAQTALAAANARASSAIQSKEEAELEARGARSTADSSLERARLAEVKGIEALAQAKAFVETVEAQAPDIALLKAQLGSAIQERQELKSQVEQLQLTVEKVTCEAKTLTSQLSGEKTKSLRYESQLVEAVNRANQLQEAGNQLVLDKKRLMDELQSEQRVKCIPSLDQQLDPTSPIEGLDKPCNRVTNGQSIATSPHEPLISKLSVAKQGNSESTIRMLQQELQDANEAIKELKETLRNTIGDSDSAVADHSVPDLTENGHRGAESTSGGNGGATPLFYAMEKQAELAQARNEISRLASLLGDAESSKQEALEAMSEMERKMEEAESRLKRHKRLGGGGHSVPVPPGDDTDNAVDMVGDKDSENANVNLEYLKNVVLSYLNATSVAERRTLLPVISTVLCFTADEQRHALQGAEDTGRIMDTVTHSVLNFRW